MHLPGLGIGSHRGIGKGLQICNLAFHLAFAHTAYFYGFGKNNPRRIRVLQARQKRRDAVFKHRLQFIGRTGKQNHPFSFLFHDNTRSSAVVIVHNNGSFGNKRLLLVIFRHFQTAFPEISFDSFQGMRIHGKLPVPYAGGGFLGQIILGRPKASRQNHKIRPFQRRPYCPRKPSAIVAHHCLIIAGQSQPRTFLRQVCCVGVDYVPQQKLSSYRN